MSDNIHLPFTEYIPSSTEYRIPYHLPKSVEKCVFENIERWHAGYFRIGVDVIQNLSLSLSSKQIKEYQRKKVSHVGERRDARQKNQLSEHRSSISKSTMTSRRPLQSKTINVPPPFYQDRWPQIQSPRLAVQCQPSQATTWFRQA